MTRPAIQVLGQVPCGPHHVLLPSPSFEQDFVTGRLNYGLSEKLLDCLWPGRAEKGVGGRPTHTNFFWTFQAGRFLSRFHKYAIDVRALPINMPKSPFPGGPLRCARTRFLHEGGTGLPARRRRQSLRQFKFRCAPSSSSRGTSGASDVAIS